MCCEIVGIGKSGIEDIQRVSGDRRFRKATINMKLAYLALNNAMKEIQEDLKQIPKDRIALFLSSGLGELGPTVKFLKGALCQDRPSPIAFQNSLHNSILGFISNILELQGPGFTLSNRFFSCEAALDAAKDLLDQKQVDVSIVIGVDSIVEEICQSMRLLYSPKTVLSEGANAIILSNKEVKEKVFNGSSVNAFIKSIKCNFEKDKMNEQIPETFYDSNLISTILDNLLINNSMIFSHKPDGSYSCVELSL